MKGHFFIFILNTQDVKIYLQHEADFRVYNYNRIAFSRVCGELRAVFQTDRIAESYLNVRLNDALPNFQMFSF